MCIVLSLCKNCGDNTVARKTHTLLVLNASDPHPRKMTQINDSTYTETGTMFRARKADYSAFITSLRKSTMVLTPISSITNGEVTVVQLVLLAPVVKRGDKWLWAGELLINCSSLYSTVLSMSTNVPGMDIILQCPI